MNRKSVGVLLLPVLVMSFVCLPANAGNPLNLLPTPKVLKVEGGEMPLTAKSRVVAADPELRPLAAILADEIRLITGLKLETARGGGRAGDIVLKINSKLWANDDILAVQKQKIVRTRNFAHTIEVGGKAVVEGWDYRAVCEGTATILQAITGKDGKYSLPRMTVKDWPSADYTGVMVDVARQRIPIDALKAVVDACRLWKIRYLQLHLSDDEGIVFPSKAFPKLGSKNVGAHDGVAAEVYDIAELRGLVAYGDARGVTLVPELNTPGQSGAMNRSMPDVFGGPKILNIANDDMYKALDTLVGEMCGVFKSSPYFHIGGDQVYLFELAELQQTKDYIKQKGMKGLGDVMVQHAMRMNGIVRKHGKMTLAWEQTATGAEGVPWKLPAPAKDEIILMCWIPWPTSAGLQEQGFTTVTVPWDLGAPIEKWNMYICNGCRLDPAKHKVLGSAQTMWMMSASALVSDFLGGSMHASTMEGYIYSLPDRQERTWGVENKIAPDEFKKRTGRARAMLARLVLPVKAEIGVKLRGAWPVLGLIRFREPVKVSLSADASHGGKIRYTTDGSEPTAKSAVYAGAFEIEDTTSVNAALFRDGKQLGHVTRVVYELIDSEGAVSKWMLAGPYMVAGKKGSDLFDVVFAPEKSGKGDWKPFTGDRVILANVPGYGGNERVAYMKTQIFSPKAQKAELHVASDDGVKVFLNGKVVHEANVARPASNADRVNVSLKKGWNRLLLKVTNGGGGWEAWVKVKNAGGGRLEKMRVKAE